MRWEDMHVDLLNSIGEKLDYVSYARAWSVCTLWHHRLPALSPSLLVLPDRGSGCPTFVSLHLKRHFELKPFEDAYTRWLLHYRRENWDMLPGTSLAGLNKEWLVFSICSVERHNSDNYMSSFILYNIMTATEKYATSLLHMNTWVSIFVFEPK
jgi:hypothetical protein